MKQMTIFDFIEPDVGEFVKTHGANICHIMRKGYVGKKVVIDLSTQSHEWYQVGILEKIVPSCYYRNDERVECDRAIVFTGARQRQLITLMPGVEIYECLPWDNYPERSKAWTF